MASLSSLQQLFDITLSDAGRLLTLSTPLGSHALLVQRVVAHEQLSAPFTFTVDCLSQQHDLDLRQLLAQPVTLSLLQADGTYRDLHAIVSDAALLGSDGGVSDYQLVLKPWLTLLEHVCDSRIFQDLTVVEIVTQVLEGHSFSEGGFRFDLRHQDRYPKRSYCVQYRESSYHFISRLLEEEGIWWYVAQEQDKHVIVFTDDNDTCPNVSPETIRFHRQSATEQFDSLTDWGHLRRVQPTRVSLGSFDYKAPGAPTRVQLDTVDDQSGLPVLEQYDYSGEYSFPRYDRGHQLGETLMEGHESQAERFTGAGGIRQLSVGHGFVLSQHPNHDSGGMEKRTFLLLELSWAAENNLPMAAVRRQMPGSLEPQLEALRDVTGHTVEGASEQDTAGTAFFHVQLEAQYRNVPYRAPITHTKPELGGPQTAIVVGPANEQIHTDSLNRVKVQFHWDRTGQYTEKSSCWLRVSQDNADSGWGAVFVPRIGQEVIVSFLEGDPDRPLITGRVYNGDRQPLWHSNGLLSGFHTQNYHGGGYNELVFDDATGQSRIRLGTDQQHSQLNLGYLIHQEGNDRGAFRGLGFELRSDAYGAVRANQGLYLSSWGQAHASGDQLDVDPARQQLTNAQRLNDQLSDLAKQHKADALTSTEPLTKAAEQASTALAGTSHSSGDSAAAQASASGGTGQSRKMSEPWLHAASPAGISLTTPQSTHLAQGEHLTLTSGQDTTIATGKSLLASITEKLSVFVYNAGIKLFAGKGKVEIQAQSDELALTAQKDVHVSSTQGKVEVAATDEILLSCGGGYIRIKGGNIEIHAPGTISVKGAQHAFSGSTSQSPTLPELPTSEPGNLQLWHAYAQGEAVPGAKYRATLSDGSVREGALDASGKAMLTGVPPGGAAVEFFREPTPVSGDANVWPRWQGKGKPLNLAGIDPSSDITK
ncbi:type VI secretion system Vgr family protein [Zymobacter palmae]|uniref:Rhs element Vgr protein n=1 Tax=Zymobacter palmae TaxID=33074 RepID=A0A348HHF0_9GAMM|nr:type VI secretion system tip protein TssI/VgrG [Zymobacter palmae]BBG31052.1 rhs element Vgr protein [Zymobacter palmae]